MVAGSSASFAGEYRTSSGYRVPRDAFLCRDWQIRCDGDNRLWRPQRDMPPSLTLSKLIDHRLESTHYSFRLPSSWGLDVSYARFAREEQYAETLARRMGTPSWFEDKGFFDSRLLFSAESLIHPHSWFFRSERHGNDAAERDFYMPGSWRRWERTSRHKYGVLVASQQREIQAMERSEIPRRYLCAPHGWERYEVSLWLTPQVPPVVTYAGTILMNDPDNGLWKVFWTEHAWTVAAELLHSARRGKLGWIPPDLAAGIEEVGLHEICFGNAQQASELRELLRENRLIRWNLVRRKNGQIPRHNEHYTPVYSGGDFVLWDPVEWCSQYHDALYIQEDEDGFPVEGPADRGLIHYGFLNAQVPHPVEDSVYNAPLFIPGRGSSFVPSDSMRTALQSAFQDAPLRARMEQEGYAIPEDAVGCATLVKKLLARVESPVPQDPESGGGSTPMPDFASRSIAEDIAGAGEMETPMTTDEVTGSPPPERVKPEARVAPCTSLRVVPPPEVVDIDELYPSSE